MMASPDRAGLVTARNHGGEGREAGRAMVEYTGPPWSKRSEVSASSAVVRRWRCTMCDHGRDLTGGSGYSASDLHVLL